MRKELKDLKQKHLETCDQYISSKDASLEISFDNAIDGYTTRLRNAEHTKPSSHTDE